MSDYANCLAFATDNGIKGAVATNKCNSISEMFNEQDIPYKAYLFMRAIQLLDEQNIEFSEIINYMQLCEELSSTASMNYKGFMGVCKNGADIHFYKITEDQGLNGEGVPNTGYVDPMPCTYHNENPFLLVPKVIQQTNNGDVKYELIGLIKLNGINEEGDINTPN